MDDAYRSSALLALVLLAGACTQDDATSPEADRSSEPATVTITPALDTLAWLSATKQFSATVLNSTGAAIGASVVWSSSATNVATVSSGGLVTAASAGTTTIVVQAGTVSGTATVVVDPTPSVVVKISGDAQTAEAEDLLPDPMVVEVRDRSGAPVVGATLEWRVTSGGGSAEAASSETDVRGQGQALWRLGGQVGGQSLQLHVPGLDPVTFAAVAQPKRNAVVRLDITPTVDTVAQGASVQFSATAWNAAGEPLPEAAITFHSTDAAVAQISESGLATGVATGTTSIVASSSLLADTATLVVTAGSPQGSLRVDSVSRDALLEGDTATVFGEGFSSVAGENRVTVGGLPATVVAATSNTLSIAVPRGHCQPARRVDLTVGVGDRSASLSVGVTPRTQEDLAMNLYWYRYTFAGNGCLHLPGNSGGGEFLIGVVSTSPSPSSLTPVDVVGLPGDPTVVATATDTPSAAQEATVVADPYRFAPRSPTPPPPAPSRPPPSYRGDLHGDLMDRNLRVVEELGRSLAGPYPSGGASASWQQGDTVSVFAEYGRTCSSGGQIRAVVRRVGERAVWLDDLANPAGTFSDGELADLDAFYATRVGSVQDTYFGPLSDVDANGRVIIVMTKEVNRGGVAGFVQFMDLYPTSQCPASNHAEIFYGYVPDPNGVVGAPRDRQRVLDYYPSLITHEVTHIIQGNALVYGGAGGKTTWEIEGGASLSEQLVAYGLFGHGSGRDMGAAEYDRGRTWYWNAWVANLAQFYGWDSSGDGRGRVTGAPEECSWIGRESQGNTGPCRGSAVYGVPSMMFRFAMDRWGADYPGGEGGLMRDLTRSPQTGFASLEAASGWRIEQILADFYMALWADGRRYDAAGMATWNLYDVLSRYPEDFHLQPHRSADEAPRLSANVRAGSTTYLLWRPTGPMDPTSIRVTTGGGPVPGHVSVWALRLR